MPPQEPPTWAERVLAVLADVLAGVAELVAGRPWWTVAALLLGVVLALWLLGRVLRVLVTAVLVMALLASVAYFTIGPERAQAYLERLGGAPVEASDKGGAPPPPEDP